MAGKFAEGDGITEAFKDGMSGTLRKGGNRSKGVSRQMRAGWNGRSVRYAFDEMAHRAIRQVMHERETKPAVQLVKDGRWMVGPELRPKGWEGMGIQE